MSRNSSSNRTTNQHLVRSAASSSSSSRGKPEWDGYINDIAKYSISKEESLLRKKERLSKNNILANPTNDHIHLTPKKVFQIAESTRDKSGFERSASYSGSYKNTQKNRIIKKNINKTTPTSVAALHYEDVTSLDYLEDDNDSIALEEYGREHYSDPASSYIEYSDNSSSNERRSYHSNSISTTELEKTIVLHKSSNKKQSKTNNISALSLRSSGKKATPTIASTTKSVAVMLDVVDEELNEMMEEIKSLHSELKYYEQLSGRKSSLLDADELERAMASDFTDKVSQRSVMRYLIRLVCQSMTYLLKSEINVQSSHNKNIELNEYIIQHIASSSSLSIDKNSNLINSSSSTTHEVEISPVRRTSVTNMQENHNIDLNAASPINDKISTNLHSHQYNDEHVPPPFTPPPSNVANTTDHKVDTFLSAKMNGNSPTDWLFKSQFTTPNGKAKFSCSSNPCLRLFPDTTIGNHVLPLAPTKSVRVIGNSVLSDLDDVAVNLDAVKFTSASVPSYEMYNDIYDVEYESTYRYAFESLTEKGLLNDSAVLNSTCSSSDIKDNSYKSTYLNQSDTVNNISPTALVLNPHKPPIHPYSL